MAAARRVGATLSVHSNVVARARAATGKINNKLADAQQLGDLPVVQHRLSSLPARGAAPREAGDIALDRLRTLLAGAAAGTPPPSMLRAVFGAAE